MGISLKSDREVLYCVVGRNEIVRLKNIITSIDEHAFVSLIDVHEVLGEGFTLDEQKRPIIIHNKSYFYATKKVYPILILRDRPFLRLQADSLAISLGL